MKFHKMYTEAERMAAAVDVEPRKPRSCARQRHRPNIDSKTIEEWYRINAAIPFLDHIMTERDECFSVLAQTSSHLLQSVLSILCSMENVELSSVTQQYAQDLPSPEILEQDLSRRKHMHMSKATSERATTCAQALKECDKLLFPNLYVLLELACILPVTSCKCEQSASTIRWLRNFMRAGMTDSRLSSLALMHIHFSMPLTLMLLFSCLRSCIQGNYS